MAWNGSAGTEKKPAIKRNPFPIGKVLSCLLLVALAVAMGAYVYMLPEDSVVKKDISEGEKIIKSFTREDLKKMVESKVGHEIEIAPRTKPEPKPSVKDDAPFGYYTNKLGQVKRKTGKGGVVVNMAAALPPPLFTEPAECQLDGLVNTPLGGNYYDYDVPEDFEEQFAFSLTNKIVIAEDDPPDVVKRNNV